MPKTRSLPGCMRNNLNNIKGGIGLHFHFDIYKGIVNDRMKQLMSEASEYRMVTKTKYVTDRKMKKNMLFRSIFGPGNAD